MMKTQKILALLLVLACCLLLTACHGAVNVEEFRIPVQFDESRQFELTFWAKNDSNVTQSAIYRQAIGAFEALYPNIHVELRLYPDYGRIYNDVITNVATGTTPNVCITYPDHIATYLTGSNVVAPLDVLIADSHYGLGGSELRFDGYTVDETLVEALGYTLPDVLTWDFVWEVSDAAMAKAEDGTFLVNGQKVMIPFIYKSTDNMMIQMLRQYGGDYSTDAGEVLIFNDTTRSLLHTISEHAALRSFSTFGISSYPGNFLNAGQCIFAVDSTAGATWMGHTAPHLDIAADQLAQFELAVLPIPQADPEHPSMISQGPSVCVFNKEDPQEVLASWLFAQFLLTNDVQLAYAETEGYVPVTLKAQQDPAYQEYLSRSGEDNDAHYYVKIEAAQLLMRYTEDTFVTPVFNGSASLRDAAGQLIEEAVKTVRRKKTVDDAYITSLYDQITSLYRLDQISVQTQDIEAVKTEMGPLPGTAVALLSALAAAWVLIGAYVLSRTLKDRRKGK